MGLLSGIWKYVAAAAGLAMTVLYALWQRKRAEHAEDKADRAEAKAEKQHEIAKARNDARKEAESNAKQKRKEVRERRAGLSNDRLD